MSSLPLRDAKVAHLLLQAQYPVLGVDGYMPVVDVFSGRCEGNLRVVLAMGRWEQIVALQRTRAEECDSATHLTRPVHLLDVPPPSGSKVSFYSGGVNTIRMLNSQMLFLLLTKLPPTHIYSRVMVY